MCIAFKIISVARAVSVRDYRSYLDPNA